MSEVEALEVDPGSIESALTERPYDPVLEADLSRGEELGVERTPTVVVNGEQPASPRYADLRSAIEAHR